MSSQALEGKKYISLKTYRRSGAEVPTPVWFVQREGRVFVWTDSTTGKVKRIRNNPKVEVAPCTMRGELQGPYVEGVAILSDDDSSEELRKAFKSKYGMMLLLSNSMPRLGKKAKRVFVSITLSGSHA
jgi:PPOX class probable F420-dependent enzyme